MKRPIVPVTASRKRRTIIRLEARKLETHKLFLIPVPKKVSRRPGRCLLRSGRCISAPCEDRARIFNVSKRLQHVISEQTKTDLPVYIQETTSSAAAVVFHSAVGLADEEYTLDIDEDRVTIGYGGCAGAFHAVSTLKQIVRQCGRSLPCVHIEDRPDFPVRGLMLDISRDKIPNMHTLFQIIDLMADFKLNHLQLYIEGFSFAYPSFPQVWRSGTPVTGEEMFEIGRYCGERFIDFVPNQNSFGHMTPWLSRAEFRDLASCPDGCEAPWGRSDAPIGLNPTDERSLAFLAKTYDDLLPYFHSDYFNVGCDETFDLGQGKSREACEKRGKGRVYLDFLTKIHGLLKERGKKMMFWGDIILKFPELIPELPKDAVALAWGYDADQPYEKDCEKFQQSAIPYYICPGTNAWNSIAGRTDCMKSNLLNAAERGSAYGAAGFLNTDWGDIGHWHPLPVSYASYCYGAALSWGVEQNRDVDLARCLDTFVFEDVNQKMGRFALALGNYYTQEKQTVYNGSGIFRTLFFDQLDNSNRFLEFLHLPDLDEKDFTNVKEYVTALLDDLDGAEMRCGDARTVEAEFRTSARLILHGADLGLLKLQKKTDADERRRQIGAMLEDLTAIISDYKANWLKRNRPGGLDDSVSKMERLKKQYENALSR